MYILCGEGLYINMKKKIEENWDEILSILEKHYDVSNIIVETWIRSLEIFDVRDNTVYFFVDEKRGKHGVEYLRNKGYDIYLLSAIREFFVDPNIELVIDEKSSLEAMDAQKKRAMKNPVFNLPTAALWKTAT